MATDDILLQALRDLNASYRGLNDAQDAVVKSLAELEAEVRVLTTTVTRLGNIVVGQDTAPGASLQWRLAQVEATLERLERQRLESRSSQVKLWVAVVAALASVATSLVSAIF